MASTISATLAVDKLIRVANETLPALLAPFKSFSNVFSSREIEGTTGLRQIPNVTRVSATRVDPVDWEQGADATVGAITGTPHLYSQGFHVANEDTQTGTTLELLAASNLQTLARTLLDLPVALFTEANFANPVQLGAAVNFGRAELDALMAVIPSPRRCLLASTVPFSRLCPATFIPDGGYAMPGFSGGVYEVNFTAAGPNIVAAALDPTGIATTTALPAPSRSNLLAYRDTTIPGLGLPLRIFSWAVPGTRKFYMSYDVILSVSVGKAASCKLVKTV